MILLYHEIPKQNGVLRAPPSGEARLSLLEGKMWGGKIPFTESQYLFYSLPSNLWQPCNFEPEIWNLKVGYLKQQFMFLLLTPTATRETPLETLCMQGRF